MSELPDRIVGNKKEGKKTITLCMIVKDEKTPHLIECFESMKDKIDYWVICDNGSTDGTQEYIREYWAEQGIPGELIEVPWEGFGKTRTRALKECEGKADYAWVIDADDYLVGDFDFPHDLPMDAYALRIKRGNFEWWRNQIFRLEILLVQQIRHISMQRPNTFVMRILSLMH